MRKIMIYSVCLLWLSILVAGCGAKQPPVAVVVDPVEEEEALTLMAVNELLGFAMEYDTTRFGYTDYSNDTYIEAVDCASFFADGDGNRNVFLSVSTSDISVEETIAGLLLQRSEEQYSQEDVVFGIDEIQAKKLRFVSSQDTVEYYYLWQRPEAQIFYMIEIGTVMEQGQEVLFDELNHMIDSFLYVDIEQNRASTVTISNVTMGFLFYAPEEFANLLRSKGTEITYSEIFEADIQQDTYFTEVEGKNQPLFTVYRMEKSLTRAEVLQGNDMLIYLGSDDKVTFALQYSQQPIAGLSTDGQIRYQQLMEQYVYGIESEILLDEMNNI